MPDKTDEENKTYTQKPIPEMKMMKITQELEGGTFNIQNSVQMC